jgi:hypothetical protein
MWSMEKRNSNKSNELSHPISNEDNNISIPTPLNNQPTYIDNAIISDNPIPHFPPTPPLIQSTSPLPYNSCDQTGSYHIDIDTCIYIYIHIFAHISMTV